MARVRLEITKSELEYQIKATETANGGPFPNRSILAEAVAESDWAKNFVNPANGKPKAISASVVTNRITELKIEPLTPKGKRGGGGGFSGTRGPRKTRAEKFAEDPAISQSLEKLKTKWGGQRAEVDKIINGGSMKAAVALKCFDCAGGSTGEVARCPVYDCALWAFRPWRGKSEVELTIAGITLDDPEEGDAPDEDEVDTSSDGD